MIEGYFQVLIAAVAGTAFIATLYYSVRGAMARATIRAAFLDDCKRLFSGGLKAKLPTGFPRISGTYDGHTFDLQAVADTLNVRKLPTLWLMVTLPEPIPVKATFDMMIRPRGVETFSRHAELPVQITDASGFPGDCTIRTDHPDLLPPQALLKRHMWLFGDDRAKELVISPKGLRVVWLADEANRARYLIFRDSEMGASRFPAEELKPILDYLLALRDDLMTHDEGATAS